MQVKALSCKEEAKYCVWTWSRNAEWKNVMRTDKSKFENHFGKHGRCILWAKEERDQMWQRTVEQQESFFFFSLNIWHVFCVLLKMKYYIYILHRPNTFFLGIPFAYWRKTLGLFVVLWQYRVHFEDKKNQPESDEFMRLWVTCVDNLLPWHFLLSYVDTSRCGPFLALSHAFQFGPSTHRKKFLTTQVHMPNVITRRFLPAL